MGAERDCAEWQCVPSTTGAKSDECRGNKVLRCATFHLSRTRDHRFKRPVGTPPPRFPCTQYQVVTDIYGDEVLRCDKYWPPS